jgi:hypothetical protein
MFYGKFSRVLLAAVLVASVSASPATNAAPMPAASTNDDGRVDSIHAYPMIGKTAIVDFGESAFLLTFDKDGRTMTFLAIDGPFKGDTDTVQYTAVGLGHRLYMVYWHEPRYDTDVVQVQDLHHGIVYSNIFTSGESSLHLKGSLTTTNPAPTP